MDPETGRLTVLLKLEVRVFVMMRILTYIGLFDERGVWACEIAAGKGGAGGEAPCFQPAGGLVQRRSPWKLSIFGDLKPF